MFIFILYKADNYYHPFLSDGLTVPMKMAIFATKESETIKYSMAC